MYKSFSMELGGRTLTVDVGRVAAQANGAAFMHYGDTTVLSTATASDKPRDGVDFFPLSVEFEEKMYSVGKIPGGFNKREGKASENSVLTARVIARPMRPLFPKDYRNDVSLNNLVMSVDPECIHRIFMEVIGGKSCTQIAKELNTEGIPTPAQHKAVSRKASSKKPQWTHRGILTMIESVKYTGTMVNHIRESRFIRDKNQRRVPKEEWYIRENAHEAIVTKDEYEQAQEAIQRRRKFVRSSHDQSDRVFICAHCGGKLEKANGTVFACPSHRYHDGSPCENVRWRKSALEEIVFEALKRQIEIVSIESAAVRKTAKSKGESLERQLVLLKAQYDACDREKFTIYENYREGKLTPEEYLSGKDALAQKQAALKEQLESCETQLEVFHQQSLDAEEQHEAASRMTGLPDDKLREHLYDAVERVLVYDTETIEIVWKFNESKIDTDENIGVAN